MPSLEQIQPEVIKKESEREERLYKNEPELKPALKHVEIAFLNMMETIKRVSFHPEKVTRREFLDGFYAKVYELEKEVCMKALSRKLDQGFLKLQEKQIEIPQENESENEKMLYRNEPELKPALKHLETAFLRLMETIKRVSFHPEKVTRREFLDGLYAVVYEAYKEDCIRILSEKLDKEFIILQEKK